MQRWGSCCIWRRGKYRRESQIDLVHDLDDSVSDSESHSCFFLGSIPAAMDNVVPFCVTH